MLRRLMMAGGELPGPAIPAPFFASDPMLATAWSPTHHPSAVFNAATNQTYVSWQFVGLNGYKGARVAAYDHATGQWGERYTAGNFLLPNDDHGGTALLVDAAGYVHCFFGAHNNGLKHSVSNNPNDVSAWTQFADIGDSLTYPKPVLVGSTIYLFARESASTSNRKIALTTMTPTLGLGAWGALKNIVDFGADSRAYASEFYAVGTEIHFAAARANASDTERKGVYYFIYDTVTGALKNYNGTTVVGDASLPVDLTTANASFRIFDHGSNSGEKPTFQFDTLGNAHVVFADGVDPTYALKHMVLSGGAWSVPETVTTIQDKVPTTTGAVDVYTLVQGPAGIMELWFNDGRDKARIIRSAAGVWGSEETISVAGALDFIHASAVANANPGLRVVYSESSGTTSDAAAAPLGLYAYGDSGPVNSAIDATPQDPAGFENVVLLLGFNHRGEAPFIIDESPAAIRCMRNGAPQFDSSQTPFAGIPSLKLSGSGQFVTLINDSAYSVSGGADFCIDGWLRPNELGRHQCIISRRTTSGSEFTLILSPTNQLRFFAWRLGSTTVIDIQGSSVLAAGVWYYFSLNRIGGVTRLFYGPAGGTAALEASATQSAPADQVSAPIIIGHDASVSTRGLNGWLADIRFTRAGRHASAFAVPTSPAPRR